MHSIISHCVFQERDEPLHMSITIVHRLYVDIIKYIRYRTEEIYNKNIYGREMERKRGRGKERERETKEYYLSKRFSTTLKSARRRKCTKDKTFALYILKTAEKILQIT